MFNNIYSHLQNMIGWRSSQWCVASLIKLERLHLPNDWSSTQSSCTHILVILYFIILRFNFFFFLFYLFFITVAFAFFLWITSILLLCTEMSVWERSSGACATLEWAIHAQKWIFNYIPSLYKLNTFRCSGVWRIFSPAIGRLYSSAENFKWIQTYNWHRYLN